MKHKQTNVRECVRNTKQSQKLSSTNYIPDPLLFHDVAHYVSLRPCRPNLWPHHGSKLRAHLESSSKQHNWLIHFPAVRQILRFSKYPVSFLVFIGIQNSWASFIHDIWTNDIFAIISHTSNALYIQTTQNMNQSLLFLHILCNHLEGWWHGS